MRKMLLTLATAVAALCGLSAAAQADGPMRTKDYNWADTDTISYTAVARDLAGDVKTYEMGVVHQGERVVFTNLFNLIATGGYDNAYDTPIEGVYDEAEGTITFDANIIYTIIGKKTPEGYGSEYECQLFCVPEFGADGSYDEGDLLFDLVFNVTPDFRTITSTSQFGLRYAYGYPVRYSDFTSVRRDADAPGELVMLGNSLTFPEIYGGMTAESTLSLVNVGSESVEYVISIEQEGEAFSARNLSGTVRPYVKKDVTLRFKPEYAGDYSAVLTVESEDQALVTDLVGTCLSDPDFSEVILNGDVRIQTSVNFPAHLDEFEYPVGDSETETVKAIRLTTDGQYGNSTLKMKVNVPEGKLGHLSYKAYYDNPTNAYYLANLFFGIDKETGLDLAADTTGDLDPKFTELDFAAGDHYVFFDLLDVLSKCKELSAYFWDIDFQLVEPTNEAPEVLTPEVFMGFGVAGRAEKISTITIRNRSSESLKVVSVESDNEEFEASVPRKEAGLLETIEIPVEYISAEPGDRVANLTIETNQGTLMAKVWAKVCAEPNYYDIVTAGAEYITFSIDEDYPFVVEDGKAWNITSKCPDTMATQATLPFEIEIPEGYVGALRFKFHSWGTPDSEFVNTSKWDMGGILLGVAKPVQGSNGITAYMWGNDVEGDENLWKQRGDDIFTTVLTNLPEGINSGYFLYYQGGDSFWYGEDRLEVYDVRIVLTSLSEDEGGVEICDAEGVYEYFDLQGNRVASPVDGINIVRYTDAAGKVSTSKKLIRK